MPYARRLTTAVAVLLTVAGPLAAQNAVSRSADPAPVAAPAAAEQPVSFAPFAANAAVGVHAKSSDMPGPIAPPRADRHNQAVTLMIIGGAALVAGAIIGGSGGTLIAVGGVVCGAIGLYKYLN
ncbi:MAG TPA: hypothetical protein VGI97_11330 [Gemmatimonadaceae bacterium]|jgi:hypothetical protein